MATRPPASRKPAAQEAPQQQANAQNIVSQQWAGPLPPPNALAQFDTIIPNGAERIMKMVEMEQQHRITQETEVLNATIRDTKRGHWIGGAISLASLAGCVWSVYLGAHPTVSVALVSLPVVAIIQAIMRNKSNNKQGGE